MDRTLQHRQELRQDLDAGDNQDKGVRIRRRIRPAPSRTIVRRVRASTTIFGAWEIRSEPSMIGCEVASTQRPRKESQRDPRSRSPRLRPLRQVTHSSGASAAPSERCVLHDRPDALVLHPTARPYTRNLLVASSFGLQLDDDLQHEIPPFRSSYQTAAFGYASSGSRRRRSALYLERGGPVVRSWPFQPVPVSNTNAPRRIQARLGSV